MSSELPKEKIRFVFNSIHFVYTNPLERNYQRSKLNELCWFSMISLVKWNWSNFCPLSRHISNCLRTTSIRKSIRNKTNFNVDLFFFCRRETLNEIRKHEQLRQAYESNSPLQSVSSIVEKLPSFDNYLRRFEKLSISSNSNDRIAFHYYVQQSVRNVLRRLTQNPTQMDSIKRILHANHLLPEPKDVIRSFFLRLNWQNFSFFSFRNFENSSRISDGTFFNDTFRRTRKNWTK